MYKRSAFCVALALMGQCASVSATTLSTEDFRFYGTITGGFLSDEALIKTAGRELQVWKMTEVLLGAEFAPRYETWSAKIELVPLADDLCYDRDDSACGDYFKNIGTNLLYYGEYPVREAAVTFTGSFWSTKTGRMENLYGLALSDVPYRHRHDAPHAYYIDKELVNGVRLDAHYNRLHGSIGVFGGRGDPGTSYNYYLDGDIDPNVKGNNTPLIEASVAYKRVKKRSQQTVYAGYHMTKTGSAVGSLYSGKHNDERVNVGLDLSYQSRLPGVDEYRIIAQYSRYTMGLTTEGVQGVETPEQSHDLLTDGFFVTGSVKLKQRLRMSYTYEELDRMDTLVWDKIAKFDPSHSSFDSVEVNHIISADYLINDHVTLSGFYRKTDFDYQEISDIPKDQSTDKFGVLLTTAF